MKSDKIMIGMSLFQAAWHAMRTKLGISPENIILYGQSIGTVPTVDLASRFEVGTHPKSFRSKIHHLTLLHRLGR